ncbi:caspase family protein [Thermogutta terrifontis]|uniref:caspase family protein n=1 Tax=Thermogutta terrifontis TaxID=1331910 RepID=UPI0012FDAB18|nr:caspase family protein [Thermogutta terrifontis]
MQATPAIIPAHVIVIMGGVKDPETDKEIWEHNVAQVKKWLLVTPYKSVEAQSEENNRALIDKLVQEHEKTKFRSFKIFTGRDVTPQDIISYVNNLPVGRDDAVFVYVLSHGGTDTSKGERLCWFLKGPVESIQRKQDLLYADDLTNTITRKNPRLSLIVSDSCAQDFPVESFLASRHGEEKVRTPLRLPDGQLRFSIVTRAVPLWWYTRLDIILARGAGRWHINSVARDQSAVATNERKELPFTQTFVTVAQLPFAFEEEKIPNDCTNLALELQDVEKMIGGVKEPRTLSEVVKKVTWENLKEKEELNDQSTDSVVKMDASDVIGFLDQSARVAILSAWEYLKKEEMLTQDFAEFYPWLLLAKDKDGNDRSDIQKEWEELMASKKPKAEKSHAGSGTEASGEKIQEGKQEKEKGVSGSGEFLGPGQGKGQQ